MNDHDLVEGLRQCNGQAVQAVYDRHFSTIEKMVSQNGNGKREDAEDIFAQTIEILYLRVTKPDFRLSSTLSTYLYAISRYNWLKQLKKNNRSESISFPELEGLTDTSPDIIAAIEEEERYALYREKFALLKEPCRRLLQMIVDGMKPKDIAPAMGYASEQYVRQRHQTCKEHLIRLIQDDPRFDELKF
ncbi:MAG: sigma-70 family RNA polymerase sigma factor [Saprospiraceae bacterium]|nr:sigma-70 family RNA polymerase sigma factor [Saprospiraceae bacterium]